MIHILSGFLLIRSFFFRFRFVFFLFIYYFRARLSQRRGRFCLRFTAKIGPVVSDDGVFAGLNISDAALLFGQSFAVH